jgi:hypothetical protein
MVIMLCKKKNNLQVSVEQEIVSIDKRKLIKYSAMFIICLFTVLHIIHYLACLFIISIILVISDRSLFRNIDYMLLITFICFFIFVGNMSSLPQIRVYVSEILINKEILVSAIISQGISNVPAAIMLASFTDKAGALLIGTNIGGLGTIIASMASLISYKYYACLKNSKKGKYLLVFSLINFVLLIIFLLLTV